MKSLAYIVSSAFIVAASSHALANSASATCSLSNSAKVDCGNFDGVNQSSCESKGCCWVPLESRGYASAGTPWCYYPAQVASGYTVTEVVDTATGFRAKLKINGDGTSIYGADIQNLAMEVVYESEDAVRIKITDANSQRWEIPESVVKRSHASAKPASMNIKVSLTSSPFSFEVVRVSDGKSLFKLGETFTFKDQYLEIPTSIDASAKTFGLGESTRLNHALEAGHTYTMWAADIGAMSFNKNLYGSYPYYLQMVDGKAHGVMLMNSNGIDAVLEESSFAFKANGGIVDLYVFNGPTPDDVVRQYTGIVGRPTMFPYWSFGFHNCKWGYSSVYEVEEIVANYSKAGIPLDTQWMDIDYMQNYRDFTYDATNFPLSEVQYFVSKLHSNGQHFVPIVDPGIMVYPGYDAYEKGLEMDLFIKDIQGNNYLAQVWPGEVYFPDFLHPSSQGYWTNQVRDFLNLAPADGLWIDMNEPSNFCNVDGNGQVCVSGDRTLSCIVNCKTVDPTNKYDFPPYMIANAQGKMSSRTVPMSASQYGNVSVYNTHNLYGLTEQIATNQALKEVKGTRPFVLSRSSFLSTGVHSAKWTGDNAATWDDLKSSIISIMDFNLFGVPMIGADICGFNGDTNEELCARWIEVGAFYPFSRDHNAINQKPQELYNWASVTQAAQNALAMRYQALPFLYSLFYAAETTGSTVVRPLWANFPSDPVALTVQSQFMWGNGLLLSPVLDAGATSVTAYFPAGYWYNFADRSFFVDTTATLSNGGGASIVLNTPLTATNVHVRGGSVLPLQEAAMTTTAARHTPFTLLVALCPGGQAFGSLFWDDGMELVHENYITVDYHAQWQTTAAAADNASKTAGVFTATVTHNSFKDAGTFVVDKVVVMGPTLTAPSAASTTLNSKALNSAQISFDATKNSIVFSNLALTLDENIVLNWN